MVECCCDFVCSYACDYIYPGLARPGNPVNPFTFLRERSSSPILVLLATIFRCDVLILSHR
jgi:hypothetical protein